MENIQIFNDFINYTFTECTDAFFFYNYFFHKYILDNFQI